MFYTKALQSIDPRYHGRDLLFDSTNVMDLSREERKVALEKLRASDEASSSMVNVMKRLSLVGNVFANLALDLSSR